MPEKHSIQTKRTAHYYTLGSISPSVKYLWIVCHGYGQLAGSIIHKFDSIIDDQSFILAPEGLSKFYWKRNPDQVGASWMSRHERLDEIEDYCNYLQSLYKEYTEKLPGDIKIILFGFSQGVATHYRWIMNRFPQFDHLIMWAGLTPEDIPYEAHLDYLSNKTIRMYYGSKDKYLTKERMKFQLDIAREQKLIIEYVPFEGRHEIDRQELVRLKEKIYTA